MRAGDDFLPTVRLDGTAPAADGVVRVRWGAVAGARAYFLSVAGANEAGDTVIWTSSETPLIAGQIPDHLAANDLRRLVANKVLLPAATSACSVPVAVSRASPVGVLRIVAFGGDREIVSPARPANAKSDWRPDYLVRLRYASSATAMLGMDEPQDPEADPQDSSEMGEAGPGALGKGAGALLKSLGGLRR